MLIDNESVMVTSLISVPSKTKLDATFPVTSQEPAGIGELALNGFGTVVALGDACPESEKLNPFNPKAQKP